MLLTIIVFIIILSVMVFFHELGHFYFARKFGVKVSEFGFGFAPRIFGIQRLVGRCQEKIGERSEISVKISEKIFNNEKVIKEEIVEEISAINENKKIKKWRFIFGNKNTDAMPVQDGYQGGTVYSLNWIPIGGFVNIKGENGDFKNDSDSFGHKKIWQRAIILSAGVAMNIILCIGCLIFAFNIGAPQIIDKNYPDNIVKNEKIQIVSILPDSPAAKAGLAIGDAIASINGVIFNTVDEVKNFTAKDNSKKINLIIDRNNKTMSFDLTTEVLPETKESAIGVGLVKTGIIHYPWYETIWLGISAAYSLFMQIIVAFALVIKNAVIGQPLGVEVAGPVGIAVMTGQMARLGFVYVLQFTALLSMNLAIINFLPFPALDGGRVLFLIIEKIWRRPVNRRIEQIMHNVGFLLLIALVIVITGRDVWKVFVK